MATRNYKSSPSVKARLKLNKQYKKYVEKYKRTKTNLEMHGLRMVDEEEGGKGMLTKTEYSAMKKAYYNERKRGGIEFRDVNARMVADQAYRLSYKQGKKIFDVMKMEGYIDEDAKFNIKTMQEMRQGIYEGQEDFYEMIQDVRADLFAQGYSRKEVREEISRTYFGSK